MKSVYLGLGSNMGDRIETIEKAIDCLMQHSEITLKNRSSLYETEPYGYLNQPKFLNMVIEVETSVGPNELLQYIQTVEYKLGRRREIHWGPRTIDIDILLYGNDIINNKDLQVPHPHMRDRLFVLIPLLEIFNGFIPGESQSIKELVQHLEHNKGEVRAWTK